ncbi:MAG: alginate export family protein [Woeseiaceae bacterium]|nr:alginate export family protein [Woeseiaceae bacterium]
MRNTGISLLLGLIASNAAVAADEPQAFADALTAGKAHVNLRYRYEHVDQDNFTETADASTLRFRLNYATGNWKNWSGFGEFDYIGELFLDDFDSGGGTSPDRTQYPVVADPEGADLNQLYLDYQAGTALRLRLGRQRINLDNQRFVGGVGWRQNEQTYDGFNVDLHSLPKTVVNYTYVTQVNRIYGERSTIGKDDENTHLLNARIALAEAWSLTPYAYYIDSEDTPAFSTITAGVRAAGKFAIGSSSMQLIAEYATQSETADAPVDFRADYYLVDATWAMKNGLSFGIAWELLGGDDTVAGAAFRTPLATLHLFQGWADQFLTTPDAGIDDIYATIQYGFAKWKLQAVYHDFSAQSGSAQWGKELDFSVARSLGDRYSVLLKGAMFDADSSSYVDADKYWLMLTADF